MSEIQNDDIMRVNVAFRVDAVAMHPDMIKHDRPVEYRGISIRRDDTIPMNEIHITSGPRLIKLKGQKQE